ncbi:ATP-grasp domain-containing protein [Thiohalomonas denitrificans]|uniref:ATP-grasp domain-containing protein n=1 Tax=Thiohalomonas denitrificans TaxID=415747 RepID=A0A1G5PV42_9GAMM|nr:ATP-grasp domain-containing protein [Thiohalomonas denitrificans]SCZ53106.1 ATP-grasp domain-containing protein [Thiohalomonas denitrificans]
MEKNIFVIGLDDFHLQHIRQVRHVEDYTFHCLLTSEEAISIERYPFDQMLQEAESRLKGFPGSVDAIIEHWDFPSSTLLPILSGRFGLRSPSLEAILKCEHKYWSRLLQQQVLPNLTPRFCAVDPFDDHALEKIDLPFPFWLKPIKSFSSHLGFRIDDENDFRHAIERTRQGIRRVGDAFNDVLKYAELPPEIAEVDGNHCIAEAIASGLQCGVEGYSFRGEPKVHGLIDTVKDAHRWSFTRYEYPSVWPEHVQQRIIEASRHLMAHIGYDNGAWCVEFFWHEDTDELAIVEINPRISQSHSDQFIKVEGASNHQVVIDVALGREPEFCMNAGKYRTAAKFLLRKYNDTVVTRVPDKEEIDAVQSAVEDSLVVLQVQEGMSLSELRNQDSYSFEIANIYLGAQSQRELVDKYRTLAQKLHFEFADGMPVEDIQFEWVKY